MYARGQLVVALLIGTVSAAIAQEDDWESEETAALDPLAQCLEVGRMRYESCAADLSRDGAECLNEHETYQAQCYELHR